MRWLAYGRTEMRQKTRNHNPGYILMTQAEIKLQAQRPSPHQTTSQTNWKEVLAKAAKAAGHLSAGNYLRSFGEAVEAVAAFTKGEQASNYTPEEQAWLLLHRSAVAALLTTLREHKDTVGPLLESTKSIDDQITNALQCNYRQVSETLFVTPADDPFFAAVSDALVHWMEFLHVNPTELERIQNTFLSEVSTALDSELRKNASTYSGLEQHFQQTFADAAAKRERVWRAYREQLISYVRRPVLEVGYWTDDNGNDYYEKDQASVPLREIFVWPRAWYEIYEHERKNRYLAKLRQVVETWYKNDWPPRANENDDLLRDRLIVSGEAGVGKSSFGRMIAANWAKQQRYILFVPLDRVVYDATEKAWDAIKAYAEHGDPQLYVLEWDQFSANRPLTVIVDGLDELSQSGKLGASLAQEFIQSLVSTQHRANQNERRLLILMAGRPTALTGSAHQIDSARQHLHIERLGPIRRAEDKASDARFGPEDREGRMPARPEPYGDLEADFEDWRHVWWDRFRTAADIQNGEGIPEVFRGADDDQPSEFYSDLLDQPLLSYFLALLYVHDYDSLRKIDTRDEVYCRIFNLFRVRQERTLANNKSPLRQVLNKPDDYQYLLELIAEQAWHGNDRIIDKDTAHEILANDTRAKKIFRSASPDDVGIEKFTRDALSGIITSFFVRPKTGQGVGKLEFSHKSFREYLTAQRLVRIAKKYLRASDEDELGVDYFMQMWTGLCGPVSLSEEVAEFVGGIVYQTVREMSENDCEHWQSRWEEVFRWVVENGIPVEAFGRCESSSGVRERARNVEEATLVVLNAILSARNVLTRSAEPIRMESDVFCGSELARSTRFVEFLGRLGLHEGECWVARRRLAWLKVRYASLANFPLTYITLDRLGGGMFVEAYLAPDLTGLDASGADLSYVHADCVRLSNSCLKKAEIEGGDLGSAELENADMRDARLNKTNLSNANMTGVDLEGADLKRANLSGANCSQANFERAEIAKAALCQAKNVPAKFLKGRENN